MKWKVENGEHGVGRSTRRRWDVTRMVKRVTARTALPHRTVGWAIFSFPSPRPSPSGRGRIIRRLLAIPATELAKPVCAKHRLGVGFSLSPRERVRVRGNDRATVIECRLSNGLLRKQPRLRFSRQPPILLVVMNT